LDRQAYRQSHSGGAAAWEGRCVKIVPGVENIVPQVVKRRTVELVATGFSDDGYLGPWCVSEFSRVRRSLDTELLHGIHGNQSVSAALGAETRYRTSQSLTEATDGHAKICAHTIDHEVVRVAALAIRAELALPEILRGEHDARRQCD